MVAEGEKFAAEDLLYKKHTEALNGLSNFVYGLRNQLYEKGGMAARLPTHDKKKLQEVLKDGSEWIEGQGNDASLEDLEEKLTELQELVSPITSKLYQDGPSSQPSPELGNKWVHTEL